MQEGFATTNLTSEELELVIRDCIDELIRRRKTEPVPRQRKCCDYCGRLCEKHGSCGKCFQVRYCDVQCQLAAWPTHKLECRSPVDEKEEDVDIFG